MSSSITLNFGNGKTIIARTLTSDILCDMLVQKYASWLKNQMNPWLKYLNTWSSDYKGDEAADICLLSAG